jgi:hypothetical protein
VRERRGSRKLPLGSRREEYKACSSMRPSWSVASTETRGTGGSYEAPTRRRSTSTTQTTLRSSSSKSSHSRFPEEQKPGEVIRISEDVLGPDQALAVDCMDIQRQVFQSSLPAAYIEGFVIIQCKASLDVTAVYTSAAADSQGQIVGHNGIDVEQIRGRQKEG